MMKYLQTLAVIGLMSLVVPAMAKQPAPLSPAQSNPVHRGTMKGFPPPANRQVTPANWGQFPNIRWSFHHVRQYQTTANVWKGQGAASTLGQDAYPVDSIAFTGPDGKKHTVKQWLGSTYTDGFIVLHDGQIAYEYYTDGMRPHDQHLMMSVTKSVTGTLAADLIARGKLDPSALVTKYIPELADSGWKGATVQQALDMTTALQFNEDYSDPHSDIFRYVVATGIFPAPKGYKGPMSLYDYLPTIKKAGKHGDHFTYRSVNPEVIGWILQRVTGKSLNELLSQKIWQKLGAQSNAYYIVDSKGEEVAAGGLNATLRDLSRFGQMILQHGKYNGQTIIKSQAIARFFGKDYPVKVTHEGSGRDGDRYHDYWWLTNNQDKAIEAWGVFGQIIHINPVTKTVIVKFSSRPVPGNSPYTGMAERAFSAIDSALKDK